MSFGNITQNTLKPPVRERQGYVKSSSVLTATAKSEQTLSQMTPGKVFTGEILSVSKDKVMLKLDNGQTVQAAASSDVKLVEGQKIAFMVKSNNGKQLAIKPMAEVPVNNSSILKALQDAGVSVNAKNTELVQFLMSEQLPIDRETITKFLRQMKMYPEVSAKTLVDLQKMGQPVTAENIAKLEGYQNHQYQLAGEIIATASEITEFIADGVKEEGNLGLKAFSEMIDMIFPKEIQDNILEDTFKGNLGGKDILKNTYSEMPVLYENLKSETMISGAKEGLTPIQQQALDNIDFVTGRYEGQEQEINHILEGMKILNDEAESILADLKQSMESPMPKAGRGDVMSRLMAAFEMYETAEKSMVKAKQVLGGEEYQLPSLERGNNGSGLDNKAVFADNALKGVLDEGARSVLAQKIYKITGDISQYFQVRAGEMSPEEFVCKVNDMLPKEVSIATSTEGVYPENMQKTDLFSGMAQESQLTENAGKSMELQSNLKEAFLQGNSGDAIALQGNLKEGVLQGNIGETVALRGNLKGGILPGNVSEIVTLQNLKEGMAQGHISGNAETRVVPENGLSQESITKSGEFMGTEKPISVPEQSPKQEMLFEVNKEAVLQETEKSSDNIFKMQGEISSKAAENQGNVQENTYKQQLPTDNTTRLLNEAMLEKMPEIKDLLQSEEFKEVLQKAVESKLLINPEEVTKEKIKSYYEKLDTQMEKLHKMVTELGSAESNVLKNTSSIRQNVDYMNQLNQLYSYVQIPLKLSGQNANSELYVMKKRKRNRENQEAFTALLHLDMEKMGSIDIYITMEQKKVAARFYLEKMSTAMFLEEHHQPLVEKLKEKGFQVTAEFEKKPEDKNMVQEFTEGQVKDTFSNKYSFDIRT